MPSGILFGCLEVGDPVWVPFEVMCSFNRCGAPPHVHLVVHRANMHRTPHVIAPIKTTTPQKHVHSNVNCAQDNESVWVSRHGVISMVGSLMGANG